MKNKNIYLIGAATDSGASITGACAGPDAICNAGLIQQLEAMDYEIIDMGDIFIAKENDSPYAVVSILERASKELFDEELFDTKQDQSQSALKNLDKVNRINSELYSKVGFALKEGGFPLVLGGDHSIGAATALAVLDYYKKIGLIWVDAHGDFNDENSSPSGNIHGMPFSAATGNGPSKILPFYKNAESNGFINPKNCVLFAARALDKNEKERLKEAGVTVFTMQDIDKYGAEDCINKAIRIASNGTKGFYLSVDLDALDPTVAPAVGTPEAGGLSYREARVLSEIVYKSNNLLGLEIVELNPSCENSANAISTVMVAINLIKTLLGETLY